MTTGTGLETFIDDPSHWIETGARAGLLSNPTGVDHRLRSTVDLVHAHPAIDLVRLYGPEHGIRGDAQAGVSVANDVDPRSGLPVTSLYTSDHSLADDAFDDIDVLLIDLQDVGVRFYTYLASANSAARRASAAGVRVLVLDRPNPISWMGVFGNRVEADHASLVGPAGIPITHGCTIGELLRHFARRDGRPVPDVVPLTAWSRSMRWADTGLPWVPPSPNLPTLDSVHLYPATCLVEGTSLSEGRGTTRPFEILGAPSIDGFALAHDLERLGITGYAYRPTWFVPTFSKHADTLCNGIQIHELEDHHPGILSLGPYLLETMKNHAGDSFEWIVFNDAHFIDRLGGGTHLRETVDNGGDFSELLRGWSSEAAGFVDDVTPDLLYGPIHLQDQGSMGDLSKR